MTAKHLGTYGWEPALLCCCRGGRAVLLYLPCNALTRRSQSEAKFSICTISPVNYVNMDPRWVNMKQLAESLSSLLAPDAPLNMKAMHEASELDKATFVTDCPSSPVPEAVARHALGAGPGLRTLGLRKRCGQSL